MLEDKRLDKDVPIPLYFQLEKLILEEIDNGNYPVGSMIPTEMELSQMFGISRTTVRQAISDPGAGGAPVPHQEQGHLCGPPKAGTGLHSEHPVL